MAQLFNLSITGDKELQFKMNSLANKLQKKVFRKALRAAAKESQKRVKQMLKSESEDGRGAMAKGLKIKSMKRSRGRVGITIRSATRGDLAAKYPGISFKRGYYPAVQEYGSKKRKIKAKHTMKRGLNLTRDIATKKLAAVAWTEIKKIAV